jgi:hypothetical protein
VTKCSICHQGINSTYIRVGEKSLLNKVGYYCSNCDIHYDLDQKPYTKNEKPYTAGGRWSSLVKIPPLILANQDDNSINSTMYENENRQRKHEVGRVGFEPTTPAMSRRYLNQARPPAPLYRLIDFL